MAVQAIVEVPLTVTACVGGAAAPTAWLKLSMVCGTISASAIVMDTDTGDVIAMATRRKRWKRPSRPLESARKSLMFPL